MKLTFCNAFSSLQEWGVLQDLAVVIPVSCTCVQHIVTPAFLTDVGNALQRLFFSDNYPSLVFSLVVSLSPSLFFFVVFVFGLWGFALFFVVVVIWLGFFVEVFFCVFLFFFIVPE